MTKKKHPIERYWIIAIGLLSGYFFAKNPEYNPLIDTSIRVAAAPAEYRDLAPQIKTSGTVMPSTRLVVRSPLEGVIQAVHFNEGQNVRKGDVLFQLDPVPYQTQVQRALAALSKDKTLLVNYSRELERQQRLPVGKKLAEADLQNLANTVRLLTSKVETDEQLVESASRQLADCSITAPIDGEAAEVKGALGAKVAANSSILVTIQKNSPADLLFSIKQELYPRIESLVLSNKVHIKVTNQDATVLADIYEITHVANAADKAGALQLKTQYHNKERSLVAGKVVNVEILLEDLQHVVAVPSTAIQQGTDGPYVYVVDKRRKARQRPLTLGPNIDGWTVIKEGLQQSETVVTEGHAKLHDGAKVKVPA